MLHILIISSNTRIPLTRKEKLKEELKVLEWHKMANNAAIKVSFIDIIPNFLFNIFIRLLL